jgi:hypothetical protein
MTQHYLFPEPGSVPGIPGLFAGMRVDVADDGTYEVSPLAQHPHFEAAAEEAPTSDVTETVEAAKVPEKIESEA